ncbi:MAG: DUF1571 domain-containing protein [Isosphaeraceae bacterium]|nr:DUF1571 domain-containing protein [Isosphaeraceae bacterium]
MPRQYSPHARSPRRGHLGHDWLVLAPAVLVLGPALALLPCAGAGDHLGVSSPSAYYSTAAPPANYPGPRPTWVLAWADPGASPAETGRVAAPAETPPAPGGPRLAAAPSRSVDETLPKPAHPIAPASDPIAEAKRLIAACQSRYQTVQDYVCTFHKRERMTDGRLAAAVMTMKVRARPLSIYVKFQRPKPKAGREGIWVSGRNGGKVIVHDVGLGKLLAGTLHVDPRSEMAMEDCRHPITEAGIGYLIDTLSAGWARELQPGETRVTIHQNAQVGNRPCTLIESTHPQRQPGFTFHRVRVYIDHEHNLPIRFEAYDWPRRPGVAPELLEEYTYQDLRLNTGLRDLDFDPRNEQYSFGRL